MKVSIVAFMLIRSATAFTNAPPCSRAVASDVSYALMSTAQQRRLHLTVGFVDLDDKYHSDLLHVLVFLLSDLVLL